MDRYSESREPFVGADVMREHAEALGMLTIYWATLDNALFHMLATYMDSEPNAMAVVAPDVSTRCEQIRKIAYVTGPDGEWRECLIAVLNKIQGELAETRNRYIHDDWELSETGLMVRIDRRPKLQKPQSRQPLQLISGTKSVIPVEWVKMLTQRIIDAMLAIAVMMIGVRRWRREGSTIQPPPQAILVRNWKPLKSVLPKAPKEWRHPQQSSPESA